MAKNYVKMPELDSERQENTKVIAVMNNKGGCGKTTTAMALGMYLARTGNNVLFWDNDPQCNLTQRLAFADEKQKSDRLHHMFKHPEKEINSINIVEYPHLQRIRGTKEGVGKIGIMPGSHYSENAADSLARDFQYGSVFENEVGYKSVYQFFKHNVDAYRKYYDYIVIDTAPALEGNILNKLAVRTAEEIIYPIDGLDAGLGVRTILSWMDNLTKAHSPQPNALFVMVKFQMDTTSIGDKSLNEKYYRNSVYRAFKESFGSFVCDHGVKEKRKLRSSLAGFGGKTEYTELSNEIIEHIHNEKRKNIFEFIAENGAIKQLEEKLADIEARMRKRRKPTFKKPRYIPIETKTTT